MNFMPSDHSDFKEVVVKMYDIIQRMGMPKFMQMIDGLALPEFTESETELQNYTLHICADHYGVSPKELKGHYVKGNAKLAQKTCFLVYYMELNLPQKTIGLLFRKSAHTIVSKSVTEFTKMDKRKPSDKEFIENYEVIAQKVRDRRQQILKEI